MTIQMNNNKRAFLCRFVLTWVSCLVVCLATNAQSPDYNYTVINTIQKKGITNATQVSSLVVGDKQQSITYFDGLGRPIQQVITQGSYNRNDIVQPIVYDKFGREVVKYLPYADGNNGAFKTDFKTKDHPDYSSIPSSPQFRFYQYLGSEAADLKPYAETVFEASPLNRPVKQGAPGEAWQPDASDYYSATDHTVKHVYELNEENEVVFWRYTYPTATYPFGTITASSGQARYYLGALLYRNKTKDEQQHQVIEYVNPEGFVLLKSVQVDASTYAQTYYIYDDFNHLVCVIQPEGVKRILQQSSEYFGKTVGEQEDFLKRWAFRYAYDEEGRMIQKQVPGAEPVYMVYDNRDRLVLTQDGRQRAEGRWLFTKYDALNRPVSTGFYTSSNSLSSIQEEVNDFYESIDAGEAWFETYVGAASGNVMGYDNKSFPQINDVTKYLTVTYYDSYDAFIAPSGFGPATPELPGEKTSTQNRKPGVVVASLAKNLVTGTWLRTVNYYDDQLRVIQTISDHHKGTVRIQNAHDFVGKVLHTQRKYIVSGVGTTIMESFIYDHGDRLLSVIHSVNGSTPVTTVTNVYNDLGQLTSKKLHYTGEPGQYVTADPDIGLPGVVYGSYIDLDTYNSAQHTQIANKRIRLLPNFHVSGGNIFKGRIGFSQQDAAAHNNNLSQGFLQVVDYSYNIRGWLSKINEPAYPVASDLFNMELRYNTPSANGGAAQYNGNISEAVWSSAGLDKQSYGYHYDYMSRVTEGRYFNIAKPENNRRYDEKIGVDASRPAYDLNGNILNLQRKGKTAATSYGLMDDLRYNYNDGNKLRDVSDDRTTNIQEEGFQELAEGTLDYLYDANGNITKDENKDIDIEYNHLNLPSKVSKNTADYIIYTYDAAGRKLSQQVFGAGAKVTDYIGELVYENDALQFITHSEGRVIADNTPGATDPWEYQYFLKDHLGNTRVVFSEKRSVAQYIATMETDRAAEEQQAFKRYNALGAMNLFDHTDDGPDYTRSHLLNGSSNYQVGLAKSLVVSPGDVVALEVYAKYEAIASPPQNTLTDLLSAAISAFSLGAGTTPLDGSQAQTAFSTQFPAGGPWITGNDPGAPKAYLNYLLFNEDFVLVDFGFDQISTAGEQTGVSPDVAHEYLSLHVQVQEKGYLYIYLSNENLDRVNVYFDDMKIVHHTAVEQVNDYYPFGLTFNSYSRENSTPNQHKYNGKELQDELSINWLDYGFRMYDPALGRWHMPDPLREDEYDREFAAAFAEEMGKEYSEEALAEGRESNRDITDLFSPVKLTPGNSAVHYSVSPYAYVLNNPINYQDWMGLDTLKEVVVTASRIPENNNHLVGPLLILSGQPVIPKSNPLIKNLFGHGFEKGANKSTSVASVTSRVVVRKIEQKAGKQVAKAVGKKAARIFFMRAGGLLGRFIPGAGWALTAYDVYDNRGAIKDFADGVREINTKYKYNSDGSWNAGWGASTCFTKGTLIYARNGLVGIDEIKSGELVYSYNLDTDKIELNKVVNTLQRETEGIYRLTTGDEIIQVTAEHPFYVEGKGWTTVKELKVGDRLKTSSQKVRVIKSKEQLFTRVTVYNIEVDGNHNYFITHSKILVHNKKITRTETELNEKK